VPKLTETVRREDGVALLLVLVIVVMTIGSVYAFARTTLLDVMGMRHRAELVRARMLAQSGVELAKRAILDDILLAEDDELGNLDSEADPWSILSREPIAVAENAELRITIRDAGSRINLNGLIDGEGNSDDRSAAFLKTLLDEKIIEDLPGRQEEKFYEAEDIANAMLDWIDTDETTKLGDQEAEFYEREGGTGTPPNRPLFALEELAGIPGMDFLLLEGLRAYFTVHPMFPSEESIGVNPNTAPPHVLSALYIPASGELLTDESKVRRILQARREGSLFCPQSTTEPCVTLASVDAIDVGQTPFPPPQFESDAFTIESEGRVGVARARLIVIVDRSDPSDMKTLEYRWE
jgi:general secretion pathway protein K